MVQRGKRILDWLHQPGVLAAAPILIFLLIGFAGPLILVWWYSLMPPKTFSLAQTPTLENFISSAAGSYYISFGWSLFLAVITVAILMLICYPVAYGMSRLFGKWANLVTLLIVLQLLVSENIRLFGWVLFLLKNGIMDGSFQYLFGVELPSILYTVPAIVLGLVYVYLPFMLFPMVLGLSMVPETLKDAAVDLGADRKTVFWEVELPLASPGLMIGGLLTFVLVLGSLAESKILGGQTVIMIADDIESAFTFAQNWPRGAALSVLVMVISGALVLLLLRRLDLDRIMGRR